MSQQITITFKLEDAEDKAAAVRALKATEAYLALLAMDGELRDAYKYHDDEAADKWRDVLRSCMDRYDVSLEELD